MIRKVKKLLRQRAKSFIRSNQPQDRALPDVGRVRVCVGIGVGASLQRLDVEAGFLDHQLFRDLLRLSEDEFGHSYAGALRIACDADLFLHLVELLRSSDPAVHYMELPDLLSHQLRHRRRTDDSCFQLVNSGGAWCPRSPISVV